MPAERPESSQAAPTGPPNAFPHWEMWAVAAIAAVILLTGLWSYSLVDPWETHYGEVARRMLEDGDWVSLKWQDENFKSKPVLTFWLMAASMKVLGVGSAGGFSGELATGGLPVFAVRLPFALFGMLGLLSMFWMMRRLVSRRAAWLTFIITLTSPFYFFVARQGITDMPMVACLMTSLACFAMAIERGDEKLAPLFSRRGRMGPIGRITAWHLFAAFLFVFVGSQLAYYTWYFVAHPGLAPGLRIPPPFTLLAVPFGVGLIAFIVWAGVLSPTVYKRQVYMYWFYAFAGISVLGKGPPAIAVTGAVCFFYIAVTGRWALLKKIEILKGTLIAVLIAIPWHIAIFLKQGMPWIHEYWNTHIVGRAFRGVFGDRGTFDYYALELGIGMWPWIALLPGALSTVLVNRMNDSSESRARTLVAIWAITGFALFALVQTKFHHYVLPVVPALCAIVALYLDQIISSKVRGVHLAAIGAILITILVCRDLIGEHEHFIELFVFRHDRPWPSGDPWNLDLSGWFLGFGVIFIALFGMLAVAPARKVAVVCLCIAGLAFASWGGLRYMPAAAAHWGQRALHRVYYNQRHIHGVTYRYSSLGDLVRDFEGHDRVTVRSVLPEKLLVGAPMTVTIETPGASVEHVVMQGRVAKLGLAQFTIALPPEELAKISSLLTAGKTQPVNPRGREVTVDADRLIAWQLNWRGENFWSGGEIFGSTPASRTVFMKTDNKAFKKYLKEHAIPGRKYFVITESGRARNLASAIPKAGAKKTVEILDTSSNKFTLLSFVY